MLQELNSKLEHKSKLEKELEDLKTSYAGQLMKKQSRVLSLLEKKKIRILEQYNEKIGKVREKLDHYEKRKEDALSVISFHEKGIEKK